MPLTNPNKVVTEERLSEFYGQILPYMGGMPDVLANKFSKGDLYSTDEKMIGVWTDSKPLYQKVIDCGAIGTGSGERAIYTFPSDIDVAFIIASWGTSQNTTIPYIVPDAMNYGVGAYINKLPGENNKIWVYTARDRSFIGNLMAVVRYTKTTDSAISIGSDTDYSTDEKIVGTWIDGKPIWQNTVSTGGNVPSGATLILRTAMASTGYDTILYTKTS